MTSLEEDRAEMDRIAIENQASRQSHGDCLRERPVVPLPESVVVDFSQDDLTSLKELCKKMPQKQIFEQKFGKIGSLLEIVIDEQLLGAMAHFFDPSYKYSLTVTQHWSK